MRCSSLPLVCKCPAAAIEPQFPIDSADIEARNGTATHAVLRLWIANGRDEDAIVEIARAEDADADEVGMLANMGWAAWQQLKTWFTWPELEVSMAAEELTGTADVLAVSGPEVRVLDWKSGFVESDATDQVRGYAWLAIQKHPECTRAATCVVRLRSGVAEWKSWTARELDTWREQYHLRQKTEAFNPGFHCRYCPRRLECEPRERMLSLAVRTVGDAAQTLAMQPQSITRTRTMIEALEAAKEITAQAELLKDLIKAEVIGAGGTLDAGDGHALAIVDTQRRTIASELESFEILHRYLSPAAIIRSQKISKSDIEDELRATVPPGAKRGAKKAIVEEVISQLDAAHCINTTISQQLKVIPVSDLQPKAIEVQA